MNKNLNFFVFAVFFVVLLIAIPREVRLQHEWLLIMEESSFRNGLKMFGLPTAYMPPLYAYYLLVCKAVFGFTDWLMFSLVLQGIIYFFSLRFLVKSFFQKSFSTVRVQVFLGVLLLFPPVLI